MASKHVVSLGNLEEFRQEVALGSVVRVSLSSQQLSNKLNLGRGKSTSLPYLVMHLDLQGINDRDELVMVSQIQRLNLTPAGELWTELDKSIHAALIEAEGLLKTYLEQIGYQVRGGSYLLPKSIQPQRGVFEMLRFDKDGDRVTVRLELEGGPNVVPEGDKEKLEHNLSEWLGGNDG